MTCFVQEQPRHLLCLNVVNMLNWGSRGTNRGSLTPHANLKQSSHQCPTIPQFCSSRPQLPPGIYHAVTGGQRQVAQLLLLSSVCTVRLSGLRPSLQLINVLSHSKTESWENIARKLDKTSRLQVWMKSPGLSKWKHVCIAQLFSKLHFPVVKKLILCSFFKTHYIQSTADLNTHLI